MKLLLLFGLFFSFNAQAEPWLANKFSQNCAACHSPGRVNRVAKKRKCTLSCQGCHVNPNGGGMRNAYGKWASKKWLKSYNAKKWIHGEKTPAPRQMQSYASKYPEAVRPKDFNKKSQKRFRKKGRSSLVSLKGYVKDHKPYDKYEDTAWQYTAKTDAEFETFMTRTDPYFVEKRGGAITNAEIRYLVLRNSGDQGPGSSIVGFREDGGEGIMSFDVGLRFKPFLNKNFSLVFEHRYLNSPYNAEYNAVFVNSTTRSAYAMYDGLPYNTYVMGGLYRPMFGHANANHRSLREVLSFGQFGGAGSSAVKYEGISLGSSPNVPFFNVHYLKDSGVERLNEGVEGYVVNAGLRFVTLGASVVGSYWSTTRPDSASTADFQKNMFAIAFGASHKGFTGNLEVVGFDEEYEFDPVTGENRANSGGVTTLELKYQVFRESYITSSFALANTTRNQTRGDSSDISIGYKIFALSGLELDLSYWLHSNSDEPLGGSSVSTDWNSVQAQVHLYF